MPLGAATLALLAEHPRVEGNPHVITGKKAGGADPVKEAADRISGEIAAALEGRERAAVVKIDR